MALLNYMSYSVSRLNTLAECDAVLASARLELKEFQTQLANIDLRQDRTDNSVQRSSAALAVNRAQLTGYEAAIAATTDSDALAVLNNKAIKVRNRIENLEADSTSRGVVVLLKMELDITQLEKQIEVTQAFISGVETKRAALAA
jgi:predicted  nucleic acid-binding Zn-ribbon protein